MLPIGTSAAADAPSTAAPTGGAARRVIRWAAATVVALAAAGGLYVAEAATHADGGDVVVAFFGLTGFAQLATAAAMFVALIGYRSGVGARRSVTALLLFGTAVTAGLLMLYVLVHGTDLFAGIIERSAADAAAAQTHTGGAHTGEAIRPLTPVAAVDALGTASVAMQLLALTGLLALMNDRLRRRVTDVLLVVGVLGWVLWLTGTLG